MERNAEAILTKALALPEVDRADIARALLDSLEPASEEEVEVAWRREVAARVTALNTGEVKTIPWEAVRERLTAKLRESQAG